MARHLLLDTSSLLYRAFFGLPTSIKAPDGQAVNAVHGYLDMTARLIASRQPDRMTHVYDDVFVPAARAEAYPAYKAHRPPDPPELPPQFDLLEEALDAFGLERASSPGWEADDAIAALCAAAPSGDEVEIVTGDRDLLQLVRDGSPSVRVLFTIKGVTDLGEFDEAAVLAKYAVPASRYVDFATLRGDPSDGLPGVPGVGEKTAQKLVQAHPTLEAMLESAPSQPKRLGQNLLAAREYLEAMKHVVPVRPDVLVEFKRGPRDADRLRSLGEARRLGGPIRRLTESLDQSPL
ncbi:MAG: 5'-3' exonuclease H3TH domain-containing protein [Chloroflexota bacterium]